MENLLQLAAQATQQNINWTGLEAAVSCFALPMSQTEQNPVYHAEGDVWTHTKMVCETLVTLASFQNLTAQEQQAVFLAALLHDIGKVPTTRWEDGRWTSPNHTLVGSKMAREFLWKEAGMCGTEEKQQLRETVCNLIRYHSFPPHALARSDGQRRLLSIAANGENCPLFTVKLLCVLCEADALGRIGESRHQMAEQVQLCQEFAIENGCLEHPFPFPSPHTKYAFLSGKEIPPEVELYDDTWGEIILLSGLPGTGKDTWIKKNLPQMPMLSLDEIRKEFKISPTENQTQVVEIARQRAKDLLRRKQVFAWNATNLSPLVRRKQIDLFAQYGAATRIVYLETGWSEQLRRNAGRVDAVPESAIGSMMRDLVPPESAEAHRVQWFCL